MWRVAQVARACEWRVACGVSRERRLAAWAYGVRVACGVSRERRLAAWAYGVRVACGARWLARGGAGVRRVACGGRRALCERRGCSKCGRRVRRRIWVPHAARATCGADGGVSGGGWKAQTRDTQRTVGRSRSVLYSRSTGSADGVRARRHPHGWRAAGGVSGGWNADGNACWGSSSICDPFSFSVAPFVSSGNESKIFFAYFTEIETAFRFSACNGKKRESFSQYCTEMKF